MFKNSKKLGLVFISLGVMLLSGCAGKLTDSAPTNPTIFNNITVQAQTQGISGTDNGTPVTGTSTMTSVPTQNMYVWKEAFNSSYSMVNFRGMVDGLYVVDGVTGAGYKIVAYPVRLNESQVITSGGTTMRISVVAQESIVTGRGNLNTAKIRLTQDGISGSWDLWINDVFFIVKTQNSFPGTNRTLTMITSSL
jgi:hypothetical protein